MKAQTSEHIMFLDVEASGLGPTSFSIEVGWAWLDGASGALLIRPASDWDLDSWDEDAEALHGISLDQLRRDGHDPRDVAEHLNMMVLLEGDEVTAVSDAADYDQRWLDPLYLQTPSPQAFRLVDDRYLRSQRFGFLEDPGAATMAAEPMVHRAEADAVRLRSRWERLIEAQLTSQGI